MRRKIPSTIALMAFDAAARHRSFTKAADELAVTQSAVCRQINSLEHSLGLKLFRRDGRGVALTESGRAYSTRIARRLDDVERDTLELMANRGQGGTIELAVVPTFATKWLLPKMRQFTNEHPGVTVNLSSQSRPFLFEETHFDAAIHAGISAWPGTDATFLMREPLVAVCSPSLRPRRKLATAEQWASLTLLQQSTRPYAWRQWFESLGLQVAGDMSGPRFELFSMLSEATAHGMGVALIPRFLIEHELATGILIELMRHDYLSERSYFILSPNQKEDSPTLTLFRDWLVTQAQQGTSSNV